MTATVISQGRQQFKSGTLLRTIPQQTTQSINKTQQQKLRNELDQITNFGSEKIIQAFLRNNKKKIPQLEPNMMNEVKNISNRILRENWFSKKKENFFRKAEKDAELRQRLKGLFINSENQDITLGDKVKFKIKKNGDIFKITEVPIKQRTEQKLFQKELIKFLIQNNYLEKKPIPQGQKQELYGTLNSDVLRITKHEEIKNILISIGKILIDKYHLHYRQGMQWVIFYFYIKLKDEQRIEKIANEINHWLKKINWIPLLDTKDKLQQIIQINLANRQISRKINMKCLNRLIKDNDNDNNLSILIQDLSTHTNFIMKQDILNNCIFELFAIFLMNYKENNNQNLILELDKAVNGSKNVISMLISLFNSACRFITFEPSSLETKQFIQTILWCFVMLKVITKK